MCHPGLNNGTVEPPVSDHQKCKDRWSLTGGGCLQESKYRVFLPRRGPGTSALWEIIYCMQCLSKDMCSSMLSLNFLVYSKYNSAPSENRDQRMHQVVAYKRLKTMENC